MSLADWTCLGADMLDAEGKHDAAAEYRRIAAGEAWE